MGETQEGRISMLISLAALNPTPVPLHFYHHSPALPLKPNPLSTDEALDLIRLTREILSDAERIMVAGGREMMFKERQAEIFEAGANATVIGNYLTTSGRERGKDLDMLLSLGHEIAQSPEDK